MARLLAKTLFTASVWAYKAARHGVSLSVPQRVVDQLSSRLDDASVENLRLNLREPSHLSISGRKKVGMWIEFSALFRLEPPGAGDPSRSLVLVAEKIQPFPVRWPMLEALGGLEGIERNRDRLCLNLDRFMDEHQWGSRVPAAVRGRVRIAGVRVNNGRIQLQLRASHRASA